MPRKVSNTMIADAPEVIAYGMMTGDFVAYLAMSLNMYQGAAAKCINARWNCPGGSVNDGVAAYNSFKNSRVPVHAYIDGIAASMGYYAIAGCEKIFISQFGRVMLHEAKGGGGGTADELRSDANQVDSANDTLISMVCKRTGMTEAAAREMFFNAKDNWYSAKEALALGLVDGIYDLDEVSVPQAASVTEIFAIVQNLVKQSKNKSSMETTNMTPQALAELGLTASATPEQVQAAQQSRITLLQQKLKEQENAGKMKEVHALLDKALNVDKKITAEFRTVLEGQYGGEAPNPAGLKTVLDAMPGFVSVTQQLNLQEVQRGGAKNYSPQVMALMAKGWNVLDKSGEMEQLYAMSREAYDELYEGRFGCRPNQRPRDMQQVQKDIAAAIASGNVITPTK